MPDVNEMIGALQQGIDKNSTEAPQLSIDPKSSTVAVVGDPNKIAENTPKEYSLTFIFPDDFVNDIDRERMTKNENGEWEFTMTYPAIRVKPLHRSRIAMIMAQVMQHLGMFTADGGYDAEQITTAGAKAFFQNLDDIASVASMVCGVPTSHLEYIDPMTLVDFFVTLMENEPNILKEAAGFIPAHLRQRIEQQAAQILKTMQKTDTQQS